MGELLPRLSILTTTVFDSAEQNPGGFLEAIFGLDVGNYALRRKNLFFCTTQNGCGTVISALLKNSHGGLFLLHFPGSRLRRTLSVILLCEARTFLTDISVQRDCSPQS